MRGSGSARWVATSAFLFAIVAGAWRGHVRAAEAEPAAPPVPVLVELFTSEGCSSCPPAEEELLRVATESPVPGARVVPLAFHVDYWDSLGWADPFSSPAWTARQGDYARTRGGRTYTPEAIVQGGTDCVGSDRQALGDLVRTSARTPGALVEVDASRSPGRDGELLVTVRVGPLRGATSGDVLVALTESGLRVAVPRGENRGRTLRHAPVARVLRRLGSSPPGGGTFEGVVPLPAAAARENLELVAFVQETPGGRVLGVGTSRP